MRNYFTHIARSSSKPFFQMPISCRSTGLIVVPSNWTAQYREPRQVIELFWTISGRGIFEIAERKYKTETGDVVMYFPGDRHLFSAQTDKWECRWLTVDGPLALDIIQQLGIEQKPHYAGTCPSRLFDQLETEIIDVSFSSQHSAACTAFKILSLAAEHPLRSGGRPDLIDICIECIFKNFSDPDFNINKLSSLLNIHRSVLSRNFAAQKKITIKKYLQMIRLKHAISLLKESKLTISEIAEQCGFSSQNYFIQAFHREMGVIPSSFR